MSIFRTVTLSIYLGLCAIVWLYFGNLQLSFSNPGLWIFLAATLGGFGLISRGLTHPSENSSGAFWGLTAVFLIAVFMVIAGISSSTMIQTQSHQSLIGEFKEISSEKSKLPVLDINNAPLVSEDMARRAAEKQLSTTEYVSLGSRVHIGPLEKQRVGKNLYWVAFLEHRDFFKWNANNTTPGYVMVSAHNPNDVKLVTHVAGKELKLRYLPTASFGDNLQRHVYFDDMTRAVEEFIPEIDDEGNPFFVAPVFKRKIGLFSGRDVVAVLVVNPQNGDIKQYSLDQAPAWIDRIQPQSFVTEQIDNNLKLAGGWWNWSGNNILQVSGTVDMVFMEDGSPYFYVGYQSTGGDNAIVGFALVNSRTKQAFNIKMSGIAEKVAESAAEKAYPEKHYQATNALPFMVEGIPTYVMALRDSNGVSRMYSMVSVASVQKIAVADTLEATVRQYLSKVAQEEASSDIGSQYKPTVLKGKILRISPMVKNGNSVYVVKLQGYNKLLNAGSEVAEEIAITQAGDEVEISVQEGKTFATIIEIKNLSLAPAK